MADTAPPAWMEWVNAPLLLLAPEADRVLALNGAMRRLLAGDIPDSQPMALERLIGAEAAAQVTRAAAQHGAPDTSADAGAPAAGAPAVTARLPGHPRAFRLELSPVDEPPGHWLVTLCGEVAGKEEGKAISSIYEDLQAVLEWMPVGIEIYDKDGDCVFTNTHAQRLFGWEKDELIDLDDWWEHAYPDPVYRDAAMKAWDEALAASQADGVAVPMNDWKVTCKDGTQKFVHFRLRCIGDHPVLVYWDVSQEQQVQAELRHRAETDELTGLRNRRRFFADAKLVLDTAAACGDPVSVMMIDIDHFKVVNDLHGHAVGDAVLRAFAERCRSVVGDGVLARLGGEEFVALLTGLSQDKAAERAEELRRSIETLAISAQAEPVVLTASIGVATAAAPFDIDALLMRADQALYAAKRAGRDRVALDRGAIGSA
ncbi:sensor domain-containing diguanylate cyclase [Ancylobacter mangrovi]|uniref:sensor domain-containing diguanylate cyclase n=1 Tax=Ancylobacter mangrovi TaxID=2972472 RepID=UPI00216393A8|nr:sensor domain-containing diguanylate cyclase [Ancylobacter mangrovi]MCS0503812.1 sensor domain-containing diguanylate cyclase [Ancylobacter mangrovi]